jgi:cysteine synthase A
VATSVLRAKGIEADSLRGGYQALRDHGLWGDSQVTETDMKSGISVESVPLPVG